MTRPASGRTPRAPPNRRSHSPWLSTVTTAPVLTRVTTADWPLAEATLRRAARGRYRAHRNLQAGLVVGGTVAVLLLEGSIQYGEAMAAYSFRKWRGCCDRAGASS